MKADVTLGTVQNLENGRSRGYKSTWRRIARALGTDTETLWHSRSATG